MAEHLDEVDFAVAAYRPAGGAGWQVQELAHDLESDIDVLAEALQRFPGDAGAVALVGLDDDAFVIVRVRGERVTMLLSDMSAADDWELADSVLDHLGLVADAADDEPTAAGDLGLLADLGLDAEVMLLWLEDWIDEDDATAEELLSDVAEACGFGELFDDALDLSPA